MHQATQLRRGCNILVATPGRLRDFAQRGHVTFGNIQFLILDEADRMLDQGFMPAIRRAISIPSMPSKMQRQTLMFSATFPSEIQRCAGELLNNYLHLQVTSELIAHLIVALQSLLLRLGLLVVLVQMWCRPSIGPQSMRRRTSSSAFSMRMGAMSRKGRWSSLRLRGRPTSSASACARRCSDEILSALYFTTEF